MGDQEREEFEAFIEHLIEWLDYEDLCTDLGGES